MRMKGADGVNLYSLKDMIDALDIVQNRGSEENKRDEEGGRVDESEKTTEKG
jgi:hypothetical protein